MEGGGGYCQGMGSVVAGLLCYFEPEVRLPLSPYSIILMRGHGVESVRVYGETVRSVSSSRYLCTWFPRSHRGVLRTRTTSRLPHARRQRRLCTYLPPLSFVLANKEVGRTSMESQRRVMRRSGTLPSSPIPFPSLLSSDYGTDCSSKGSIS